MYLFQTFRISLAEDFRIEDMKPGTLLKMLLILRENDIEFQKHIYQKYVPSDTFPQLYLDYWLNVNTSDNIKLRKLPFHDLFAMLSSRDNYSSIFDAEKHVKVHFVNVYRDIINTLQIFATLRCLTNVRVLINVRSGKFLKINKHTGPNKSTWVVKN